MWWEKGRGNRRSDAPLLAEQELHHRVLEHEQRHPKQDREDTLWGCNVMGQDSNEATIPQVTFYKVIGNKPYAVTLKYGGSSCNRIVNDEIVCEYYSN